MAKQDIVKIVREGYAFDELAGVHDKPVTVMSEKGAPTPPSTVSPPTRS